MSFVVDLLLVVLRVVVTQMRVGVRVHVVVAELDARLLRHAVGRREVGWLELGGGRVT